MSETSIERLQGDSYCNVYTSERKFTNQLRQLQHDYPDEVQLTDYGDGSLGAKVPYNWLRFVKPPAKRNFTDEQRQAMGERMKKTREKKDEHQ